ncbi:MAG TPA: AAA family ATPase [Casimicrobiaceae bacterium]|nr:AAA family ATPase [Casimicrobiaceae bacterium]
MPLRKKVLVLLIGVLAIAVVLLAVAPSDQDRSPFAKAMAEDAAAWFAHEQDLSTLGADLRNAAVSAVGVTDRYVLVTRTDDTHYYVNVPAGHETLAALLAPYLGHDGLKVFALENVQPPRNPVAAAFAKVSGQAAYQVLVLLLLLGAAAMMMTPFLDKNGSFRVQKKPSTRFDEVLGVAEAKAALADICSYLRSPKAFTSLGAKPPRGVLLEGPPGTGKTLLARALAGECGASFIALSGSDFSDKFLGVGVARVRKLFRKARELAPCVLFIDEIDGIGQRASASSSAADTENNRIIDALLVELDGFQPNDGVIVVGATNHSEAVDPALLRDGRFDRTVYLSLPNLEEREALFRLYGSGVALAAPEPASHDQLFRSLSRMAVGLSPASIANVVNAAAVLAVQDGATAVTLDHFQRALEQKRIGAPVEAMSRAMSAEERRRIAVHESGHALIARLTSCGVVEKVTIIPRGRALGVTLVTQDEDQFLHTRSEMLARIEMMLGGRAAELLVLGEASSGASDDLKRASELAYKMVSELGLGTTLGAFSYAALNPHTIPTGLHDQLLREARDVLESAAERCDAHLTEHRAALDRVVNALLDQETIPGQLVEDALGLEPKQRLELAA